ncbi:hypothetical protein PINS_up004594 [Pythium insidiosum]|nr:hypothetical protein PINS_up004594 [Pythium insidiosum]
MTVAASLFSSLLATGDHERCSEWLHAMCKLSAAEAEVQTSHTVSLNALHGLQQAERHLQCVETATTRFGFALAMVRNRIAMLEAMQHCQLLASEVLLTGRYGGYRVQRLADRLRAIGDDYKALRANALGLSSADLDCLALHANACALLLEAIEMLLLEATPANDKHNSQVIYRSVSGHVPLTADLLSRLATDLKDKIVKIQRLPSSRRAFVGATILQQLLTALHELSWPLPHQFFRSSAPSPQKLHASVQFLTHSERTSSSSKTRPRSTLGVAHGTEFTCTLVACVAMQPATWRALNVVCIRAEVLLYGEDKSIPLATIRTVEVPVNQVTRRSGAMSYEPIELPVHVSVKQLGHKGSFTLQARISLVDHFGETWLVESTGGQRGVIVY